MPVDCVPAHAPGVQRFEVRSQGPAHNGSVSAGQLTAEINRGRRGAAGQQGDVVVQIHQPAVAAARQRRGDGAGGHRGGIGAVGIVNTVGVAGGAADARGASLPGEIQLHTSLVQFGQNLVLAVLRLRQSLPKQ